MANWLTLGPSKPILPGFFSFTLVYNHGTAFGVGSTWPAPLFMVFSAVALIVVFSLLFHLKPHEKLSRYGLSMILGGALGNIINRLYLGYVVDFLDIYINAHHWPSFNLADCFITVGAIFIGLDMIQTKQKN